MNIQKTQRRHASSGELRQAEQASTGQSKPGNFEIDWKMWAPLTVGFAAGLVATAAGVPLLTRRARTEKWRGTGLSTAGRPQRVRGVRVRCTTTIARPTEELYRFWRNLESLPQVMSHLESVRKIDDHRSHWVAKGPLGRNVEWDAEIISDKPNEHISWKSLSGSTVESAGSVHFKPIAGKDATEVKVMLAYDPPAGKVGAALNRIFGESVESQVSEDLRHFKRWVETGEVPTTAGQPHG